MITRIIADLEEYKKRNPQREGYINTFLNGLNENISINGLKEKIQFLEGTRIEEANLFSPNEIKSLKSYIQQQGDVNILSTGKDVNIHPETIRYGLLTHELTSLLIKTHQALMEIYNQKNTHTHGFFDHKDVVDIQRLNAINPEKKPDACFWAAIEATKVLLSPDYDPLNIQSSGLVEVESELADTIIANKSHYTKEIHTREDLITFLHDELKPGETIIAEHEGDHYYNFFKSKNGVIWLIDADRQVYKQINKVEDLTQSVKAWGKNEKFDYFYLEFASDKYNSGMGMENYYQLTVYGMKNVALSEKISDKKDIQFKK